MPTRKISAVNADSVQIPKGVPVEPVQHIQATCAVFSAMTPADVSGGAINNTLGQGRLKVTAPMGTVGHKLKLTGRIRGIMTAITWDIPAGAGVYEGPNDVNGFPLEVQSLSRIQTLDGAGAPLAPGAAVKIEWVRPGCKIAADASETAHALYQGNNATTGAVNAWLSLMQEGSSLALCKGGWAYGDALVSAGAAGLRKRAMDEAADVVTLATAASTAMDGQQGLVSVNV